MSALADLIEDVVERHVVLQQRDPTTTTTLTATSKSEQQLVVPLISEARMTQTRYLMQVPDEKSFRSNVSQEQLHIIETKELSDILCQLSTDVERQQFRFPSFCTTQEHQQQVEPIFDDRVHRLGHSFARIEIGRAHV